MRLVNIIIVALLAISMTIFPFAMSQANAQVGHQQAMTATAGQEHAAADEDHEHANGSASCHQAALDDCAGLDLAADGSTDAGCCGMGACHAFQSSAPPILSSPTLCRAPLAITGDQQVVNVASGRIDRPPRAV